MFEDVWTVRMEERGGGMVSKYEAQRALVQLRSCGVTYQILIGVRALPSLEARLLPSRTTSILDVLQLERAPTAVYFSVSCPNEQCVHHTCSPVLNR